MNENNTKKHLRLVVDISPELKGQLFELAHINRTTMSGLIKKWIEEAWKAKAE